MIIYTFFLAFRTSSNGTNAYQILAAEKWAFPFIIGWILNNHF